MKLSAFLLRLVVPAALAVPAFGQVAAVTASLAIKAGTAVQALPYATPRPRLLELGQVLGEEAGAVAPPEKR